MRIRRDRRLYTKSRDPNDGEAYHLHCYALVNFTDPVRERFGMYDLPFTASVTWETSARLKLQPTV